MPTFGQVQFYTRQEITTSKMEAMQSAVNGFIDQVAENAAGATMT